MDVCHSPGGNDGSSGKSQSLWAAAGYLSTSSRVEEPINFTGKYYLFTKRFKIQHMVAILH